MTNFLIFLVIVLVAGCSAPEPPQVSLTGDVDPVNFQTTPARNIVIKSQQAQGCWRKQFVYTIDDHNPLPEFFYVLAHADKIIATIKPPFVHFVFNKLQADLRKYGITTLVELFVVESMDQYPQVILECIKLSEE